MATTAEQIRKEQEAMKKKQKQHRERVLKLEDMELKRVFKIMKQANYFDVDLSDDELLDVFEKVVKQKKSPMPINEVAPTMN